VALASAGELAQIKLPRQIFRYTLDLNKQFFNGDLALPEWKDHTGGGGAGVVVMDVDGEDHVLS
jgi:hypothetical protein